MRYRAIFSVLAITVLLSGLLCTFSWSQAETSPKVKQEPQSVPSAAPVPIPAAKIAFEVEAANSRLRQIRLDLDRAVKLSDTERQLAHLTASVQRIEKEIEAGDLIQEEELFNFRQELTRFSLRLRGFQDEMIPRSNVLEERRAELSRLASLWNVTYFSLSLQEAPASSRDLVRSTQQKIDEMVILIRGYRPVLLTTQDRISEQRIKVDALLARTNDAIDKTTRQLFTIDSKPLWRVGWSVKEGTSVADWLRHLYLSRALPLFDYVRENHRRFLTHLLISLFLAWLLIAVSRGDRKWLKPTGDKRELGKVLTHPLAAALVVSLLLSFSFYPNPPLTLYRLPLLLMVFPLARVVSGAFSREERSTFYFLAGLYVFWRLDGLFASADLMFRLFLLVMTCLGIFGALWGASVDRAKAKAEIRSWRRARLRLFGIAAVILLGSLVANIVGNVTLSILLTGACISSAYAASAIFAGVLVLEAFILPLFNSPLAQMSLAVREQGDKFQRRWSILLRFGALVVWIWSTLQLLRVSEPILAWLSSVLTHKYSFSHIVFSLGGILVFLLTISISVLAARFAAFVTEKDILARMRLPQGIPATASMLVRDSVVGFGFVLALAGAGIQWSQIVLVASAIGVGIGFGLQQLVASFIAGLILIFERPIRVGDTVELGKMEGTVSRIGLRSSTVRAVDGSEIIYPNSRLISEELINWTLSDHFRRIEVLVGIPHGTDSEVVLAVLKEVARDTPGVLQKPTATALFRGFGESSLTFALRVFTLQDGWIEVCSKVCVHIERALREKGIEVALPRRDIRIAGEPSRPQIEASAILSRSDGDAEGYRSG